MARGARSGPHGSKHDARIAIKLPGAAVVPFFEFRGTVQRVADQLEEWAHSSQNRRSVLSMLGVRAADYHVLNRIQRLLPADGCHISIEDVRGRQIRRTRRGRGAADED